MSVLKHREFNFINKKILFQLQTCLMVNEFLYCDLIIIIFFVGSIPYTGSCILDLNLLRLIRSCKL